MDMVFLNRKVLAEALHAIRSLVFLATNETPHEKLFLFPRRAMNGVLHYLHDC